MSNELDIPNTHVLEAWCDTPSHFLPHTQRLAAASGASAVQEGSPRRAAYSPAEVSQYSVDLLLREYYKMVTAHAAARHKPEGELGWLQQAFLLLLCPAAPSWCDLDQLLKAAAAAITLAAASVVYLACVLVPAWLAAMRLVWQQQGPAAAAAVGAGGLAVLLLCDAVYRPARARSLAAAASTITAATLQPDAGGDSHGLDTLRAASKTATTSNSTHRPGSLSHQVPRTPTAAPAAAAPPGQRSSAELHQATYASLAPDLAALHAVVGADSGGGGSSCHAAPGSREHVTQQLTHLCEVLGVRLTPDMVATPAAAAATITQLKHAVGI